MFEVLHTYSHNNIKSLKTNE